MGIFLETDSWIGGPDIEPLFDPNNAATVGALGLILSGVGFLVTIVGLGITFWQLLRTKKAVHAANTATDQLRKRIAAQNTAIHAVNANARLKAAQRELRSKEWSAAYTALEDLREILLIIYLRKDHIGDDAYVQIAPFLKDLMDFTDHLERKGAGGIADNRRAHIIGRLRELSTVISTLVDDLSENLR